MENQMSALTLFNPLPFNSFIILNSWIWKIRPISQIMPRIKEKIETIITEDRKEINPNKSNLLGATKIRVTRTPKGKITTNAKGRKTTTSRQNSLARFVVSMDTTLTITPKLINSNGWNNPWTLHVLQRHLPLSKPHKSIFKNHARPCCKNLFHTNVWWIPNNM